MKKSKRRRFPEVRNSPDIVVYIGISGDRDYLFQAQELVENVPGGWTFRGQRHWSLWKRQEQKKIHLVELKEPQDYNPLSEEPEGELVDFDEYSRTYKTGDKQYTTAPFMKE